jgi:hypothetical protein
MTEQDKKSCLAWRIDRVLHLNEPHGTALQFTVSSTGDATTAFSRFTEQATADAVMAEAARTLADTPAGMRYVRFEQSVRDAERSLASAETLASQSTEAITAELQSSQLHGEDLAQALAERERARQAAVAKLDATREGLALLRAAAIQAKGALAEPLGLALSAALAAKRSALDAEQRAVDEALAKLLADTPLLARRLAVKASWLAVESARWNDDRFRELVIERLTATPATDEAEHAEEQLAVGEREASLV